MNESKLSHGLIDRHHFDSKNITQKQSEIEQKFKELQKLKEYRSQRLRESEKFLNCDSKLNLHWKRLTLRHQ